MSLPPPPPGSVPYAGDVRPISPRASALSSAATALTPPGGGLRGFRVDSIPGDPRDGGRRVHRGYDVFPHRNGAEWYTDRPVEVRNVRDGQRQGITADYVFDDGSVWTAMHLREPPRAGRYNPGELVGIAGNTGNAATTPAHFHMEGRDAAGNRLDPWSYFGQGGASVTPRGVVDTLSGEGGSVPPPPSGAVPYAGEVRPLPGIAADMAGSVAQQGVITPGEIEDAQATRLTLPEGSEVQEGMAFSFPEVARNRIANYLPIARNPEDLERHIAQTMRELYAYEDFRIRPGQAARGLAAYRRDGTVPEFEPITFGPDGQPLRGPLSTLEETARRRAELLQQGSVRNYVPDTIAEHVGDIAHRAGLDNVARGFSSRLASDVHRTIHGPQGGLHIGIRDVAEVIPGIGGFLAGQEGVEDIVNGSPVWGMTMIGLGALDFIPGYGPLSRVIRGAPEMVDDVIVRETIAYSRRAEQEGRRHLDELERRYTEGQFDLSPGDRARLFDEITATRARLEGMERARVAREPVPVEYELPSLVARARGRDPGTGVRGRPESEVFGEDITVTAPSRGVAAAPQAANDPASAIDLEVQRRVDAFTPDEAEINRIRDEAYEEAIQASGGPKPRGYTDALRDQQGRPPARRFSEGQVREAIDAADDAVGTRYWQPIVNRIRAEVEAEFGASGARSLTDDIPPPPAGSVQLPSTAVVRPVRPEDIVPIPANQVEDAAEAARMPSPRQLVDAPDEMADVPVRRIQSRTNPDRFFNHRGYDDAEMFLRRNGGIRDDGGELRHIGITNAPRRGFSFAGTEQMLGRIVSDEGMSLDEAGEALWSAGYLRERPTVADVVEILRAGRVGEHGRLWHPDDIDAIQQFETARESRHAIEAAADAGRPYVDDVGQPITREDLDALTPPDSAYEDAPRFVGRVGNLNLHNVDDPEQVSRLVQAMATRVRINPATREVVTNEETRLLARDLGTTPERLLSWQRGRGLPTAEEIYAMRAMVHNGRKRLVDLARRTRGASDADVARFHNMVVAQARLEAQLAGVTRETGRALQQYRMIAEAGDDTSQAIKAYLRGAGGRETVEEMAEAVQRIADDPGAFGTFVREAPRVRKRDMINELWVNSLLSGPKTHVVNFVSNALTAAYALPEQALAATFGRLLRTPERVLVREVGARAAGLIEGSREGLAAMRQAWRTGEPLDGVSKVEARNYQAIPGRAGRIIRTPTRALTAADEFWKAVNRRAATNALAFRRATRAATPEARRARYQELRYDPDKRLRDYADEQALYYTFQTPLKGGRHLQNLANDWPGVKFILPFVRTPINLLRFAAERNVATAWMFKEFRQAMRAGGVARDEALARVTLGTGLSAWMVYEAANGRLTGAGPSDPREREALLNSGWQPYSVRIGDRWVSYQRFDPFSMLIGAAADFAELGRFTTEEEGDRFASAIGVAIARNITSRTWLSGLSDFFNALSDPERHGERFFQRLASSFVVPAISAHAAGALDPNLRSTETPGTEGGDLLDSFVDEMRGVLNAVRARLPIVSHSLDVRLNVWGEPIRRGSGEGTVTPGSAVYDFLSPVVSTRQSDSPMLREFARLRAPVSRPQRSITINRERVRLTPEQYQAYIELSGQPARRYFEEYVRSDSWRSMNDEERREFIRETMEDFRAQARDRLRERFPALDGSSPPPAITGPIQDAPAGLRGPRAPAYSPSPRNALAPVPAYTPRSAPRSRPSPSPRPSPRPAPRPAAAAGNLPPPPPGAVPYDGPIR